MLLAWKCVQLDSWRIGDRLRAPGSERKKIGATRSRSAHRAETRENFPMKLFIVKRGRVWQLAGSYAGKRIRISLGTANESFATDIKRNIENAIIRGNDSQYWPELRRILPPQSFRTLAATAEYTEPVIPATPTWLELRTAFGLHMNYRVAISKLAASTRQRYQYTLHSFEEFLNNRQITELPQIDRPLIEAYKVFRHARIRKKKYSREAGSLSLDVAILHSVFTLAVEKEMMIKNPVKSGRQAGR